MVVRDRVGRKRYIAFEILHGGTDLTRGKLSRAIEAKRTSSLSGAEIEVILIAGSKGIVRVGHMNARLAVDLLNSFDHERDGFALKSIKTSGTIRKLKVKYFGDE